MRQAWRKVLLVLVCCVLAVAGCIGLLNLAEVISAARSYRASPAELRAAADAAVLPAADPAFSGSGEYTDVEQAASALSFGCICRLLMLASLATVRTPSFGGCCGICGICGRGMGCIWICCAGSISQRPVYGLYAMRYRPFLLPF